MTINYNTLAIEVADKLMEGKMSFAQIANMYGLSQSDVEYIWSEVCEQMGDDEIREVEENDYDNS